MNGFLKRINTTFVRDIKSIVLSLGIAVVTWIVINFNIFPIVDFSFSQIPIQATTSSYMAVNNFEIVSELEQSVSFKVQGKRLVVNSLKDESFRAYLDLSNVYGKGKFNARVIVEPVNGEEVEITSITPASVEIQVDKIITKQFPIQPEAPGIKIQEGFKLGELTTNPKNITLKGSDTLISSIGKVSAVVAYESLITQSIDTKGEIVLYNQNGGKIENAEISKEFDSVSVHIPISMQKNLPLSLTFTNVPSGFDISTLKYSIFPESIDIASKDASIAQQEVFELGAIDLANINLTDTYYLTINLPEGYENLSGNNNAAVKFENEDYGRVNFNVNNITIMNSPNNFDVKLLTNVIEKVTVIGPYTSLSGMTADDIVATVNLLGVNVYDGTQEVNVSFTLKRGGSNSWVVGKNYRATINATPKEAGEIPANAHVNPNGSIESLT